MIITGGGLATALGAKLLYDVCGPTAKYIGGQLASSTKAGIGNLQRIFSIAANRARELGKFEGQLPPRLLKNVLEDGYFCEDEIEALYLGGVLASAKGPISRDDRSVAYCSLLSSLSTYQIRTHYILYSCILKFSDIKIPQLLDYIRRGSSCTVLIRESDYLTAMEYTPEESSQIISEHAFIGLEQKGLSEGGNTVNFPNNFIKRQPTEPFRAFYPTVLGIELFLWGLGLGDKGLESYSENSLSDNLPPTVIPIEIELGKVFF